MDKLVSSALKLARLNINHTGSVPVEIILPKIDLPHVRKPRSVISIGKFIGNFKGNFL